VGAREDSHFAHDRTDLLKVAAVEALAVFEDQFADGLLLDVIERVVDDERRDFLRAEFFDELRADFILDGVARAFAGEFAGREQRGHEAVAGERLGLGEDLVGDDLQRDFTLLLAGLGGKLLLRGDERLDGFLGVFQRGVEIGFGDFPGRTLEHDNILFVADVDEVEVAFSALGMGGVGDEFAVDAADAHGAERPGPRDVADHQRGAGADDAQHIRFIFAVRAQKHGLHLDFVVPALRKKRADGTVGEAAGEDFLLGRPAFALEVTAGELARGCGFFAVIHGEREKVLPFLGLGGGHGGDDDDRFAELHGDGAVGLLGQFAGFNDDLFVAQLSGDFL
jgi:hypothetical protein